MIPALQNYLGQISLFWKKLGALGALVALLYTSIMFGPDEVHPFSSHAYNLNTK